jgi:hypothetical protein
MLYTNDHYGRAARAQPVFGNPTAVEADILGSLIAKPVQAAATMQPALVSSAPWLGGSTAPLQTSRAIARIQMRNRRRDLLYCHCSKTIGRNHLQQPRPSLPSRSLRKIRDLIIFAESSAGAQTIDAPSIFVSKPPK